jgi:hypothetical protein
VFGLRRALLVVAPTLIVITIACGGDGEQPGTPTPEPTAIPTPTATAVPPSGPTVVRAQIDASCVDGPVGADLIVHYTIAVPQGRVLNRVRLFVDGEEKEDSESLSQQAYARIATIAVDPGSEHTYRIEVETPGESKPYELHGSVACPDDSGPAA